MATFFLGLPYHSLGDYRQAIHYHRKNVKTLTGAWLHERCGEAGLPAVFSHAFLEWSLAELGEFAEGMVRGAEAVQIAEATVEQPFTLSHAYLGVGLLHLRKGDLPQAIAVLERSLGVCQAGDIQLILPYVISPLGYAYALSGRLTEALPLLEQAVEQSVAMNNMSFYPLFVAHLGEAYPLAAASRTRASRPGMPSIAPRTSSNADTRPIRCGSSVRLPHSARSRMPRLTHAYRQALTLAEELGMRPLQVHCHRGLGLLYAATGQREPARRALSTALEMYRIMDMTFWLPQTEAALAQVDA